jgi:ABC-2 type transport system ATP-binding protein
MTSLLAAPSPAATAVDTGSGVAIETDGLTKSFGKSIVVEDLALRVPTGSVFGFLGPNGSGKTTTIRMLLGLLVPDDGAVRLLGSPIPSAGRKVLPSVGALIADGRSPVAVRAAEPVAPRRGRTMPTTGRRIASTKHWRAVHCAAPSATRRSLACASGWDSNLAAPNLILDGRPTHGSTGHREIVTIRELAADKTVFLSSHLLAEIEQVCTHVAIMSAGRLVAQGELGELQSTTATVVRIDTDDTELAAGVLRDRGLVPSFDGPHLTAKFDGTRPEDLSRALVERGVGLRGFVIERPSLEDYFVALTGEGFDVAQWWPPVRAPAYPGVCSRSWRCRCHPRWWCGSRWPRQPGRPSFLFRR